LTWGVRQDLVDGTDKTTDSTVNAAIDVTGV
jgi:hypothetical protein